MKYSEEKYALAKDSSPDSSQLPISEKNILVNSYVKAITGKIAPHNRIATTSRLDLWYDKILGHHQEYED